MKITEGDIKSQIKDYLAIKHIFNYPLLQGIGSFKGIPDRIMHLNGKVVYLEIKKPKGKLSPGQVEFKAQCERDNVPYFVVTSLEEVQEILEG